MKRMTWLLMCGAAAFALTASAEQGAGQVPGKGERFKKADANGDGKLSPTEFATMSDKGDATKKFAFADTDKDGFLTMEELIAAKKAHAAKEGEGHKGKAKHGGDAAPK